MTPILAILTLSCFCWAYVMVLTVIWFRAVARTDLREHVGHFVGLMGVLVPGVSLTLVMLLAGAVFGIAWLFPLLVLAFPAAIATGLHLEVAALTEPDPGKEAQRVVVTVLLAAVMSGYAVS